MLTTRTILKVGVILAILLGLTVGLAFLDLGPFDFSIAMLIALAKAFLVAAYFMELKFYPPLMRLFAGAGFLWLFILLLLIASDYSTRIELLPR